MAVTFPDKIRLTYTEYVQLPDDDGKRHEIIDGDHYVTPAPTTYHQKLSRKIRFQLYEQIELTGRGEVYDAPTDLQLTEFDIVQPDIVVLLADKLQRITPAKIEGTPDLVIEILSESTETRDLGIKLVLYRRTGVPEYWVVDPEEQSVGRYLLTDGEYELVGQHRERIEFRALPEVSVDLDEVW